MTRQSMPCAQPRTGRHGARDRDRVLDHREWDHDPEDTDDHRRERERRHRTFSAPRPTWRSATRQRRLAGRDDRHDDFTKRAASLFVGSKARGTANRANGRAERRQPRGLPGPRLRDHSVQRDPRRHVRPGVRELDGYGTGHETQLQHDGEWHNSASHADDNRRRRQRRHRHDGAVGGRGSAQRRTTGRRCPRDDLRCRANERRRGVRDPECSRDVGRSSRGPTR